MTLLEKFLTGSHRPRIGVFGDLMLDRYTWGNAARVSPEAPVLVLQSDEEEIRGGGAASTAVLARGLDADVSVVGLVGDDPEGRTLQRLLQDAGVDMTRIVVSEERPTTLKQRFVARAADRHPHQVLRVDRESTQPANADEERELTRRVVDLIDACDVLLISDYAKGVCTPSLLRAVIDRARAAGLQVLVDPARLPDLIRYRGATLLKPNRLEAEHAAGHLLATGAELRQFADELRTRLELDAVVLTLDADGMAVVSPYHSLLLPTSPRSVYDITGAGDMVLAALGLGLASGMPLLAAAVMANNAAGLEVERFGIEPVTRSEILAALQRPTPPPAKVVTTAELEQRVAAHRAAGRTIAFTNGCFDLLHIGHVAMLREAAELADVLIVAVNSDVGVCRLKGPDRPVISENTRAALLAAVDCVDHVVVFDDDTPHELLRRLRPDVLVKGGSTTQVIGREVVQAYGGHIVTTSELPGLSATTILSGARQRACVPVREEI